jgi:hypothetical protein
MPSMWLTDMQSLSALNGFLKMHEPGKLPQSATAHVSIFSLKGVLTVLLHRDWRGLLLWR